MAVLLCPLCSQPRFNNLESLRLSLLNAATQSISCPICSEVLMGLDKLTIHLFGHTLNTNAQNCLELKISKEDLILREPPKLDNECINTELDKILNADIVPAQVNDIIDGEKSTTVNIEDLNFLTNWEVRQEETTESAKSTAETELSEYMSELLNKKLPVLNFEAEKKPEPEQFKCPNCDFVFQNSIILSMHQEMVHSTKQEPPEPPDVLKELVMPRYDCHICTKSFKLKGSLLVHYRVAHVGDGNGDSQSGVERNFRCQICSKSFKKEQHLTQHIKTHEGKQWRCETCNKHFTTKYFLKKHQRLHTGEMPYSCQTCNKTFTFQQSYHKHLLYHSDEKPHQCSQCGRAFKELSTLHNHQRIHSGEKPFACDTCGKCFRQRVSYIVHQRIHTGVLPYQCTACKKKFRYKVSQRSHKCTAQPPGVVVRQPADFIQKILEQTTNNLQISQ